MHAQGFISGATLQSVEEPSIHVVICTWKSIEDWNNWAQTTERKAFKQEIQGILAEPEKINPYQYE